MQRITALILCLSCPSFADQVIDLNPFVVVAPNMTGPESVVDARELRESKPIDLGSILSSQVPDIALSRKSPLAGDVVLRGMSKDNVLITVDDTKTFCACPNRMDPPIFHVSSQQVESLSIRKGPFSVKQGATTGGAIFVKSRPADEESGGSAYFFAGSFGFLAGGLSGGTGELGEGLYAQSGIYWQQGDVFEDGSGTLYTRLPGTNFRPDYQDGRSFEVLNLEAKASASLSEKSSIAVGYALQDARDVLYPGLKMDAITDTLHRGSISFKQASDGDIMDEWSVSFALSQVHHDMQDTYRMSSQMNPNFAKRGFMMRTVAEAAYYGLQIEARKALDEAVVSYGLDLTRREWDADNQLMMMTNDMLPDVRSEQAGAWAVYESVRGDLRYEAGARLDFAESEAREDISFLQNLRQTDSNRADDVMASAYLLMDYTLNENQSVYAGIGRGSRLPDPQERYINLNRPSTKPEWIGNPDLDPVTNTELQLGTRYRNEGFSLSANLFHSWLSDYIYLSSIMSEGSKATTYENIDARIYGLSMNMDTFLTESVSLNMGMAWQEGVKSSSSFASSNDYLAEVPPLRAIFGLTWQNDDLYIKVTSQFQDDLTRVDTDLNEREIDSSWTFNVLAHWQLNDQFTISAGVDNIFDETYAVANSFVRDPFSNSVIVNEPGRFCYIRLSVEI
ncbi:MAG: TonB-dependent receptor [Puniceicoccaceae bacterium]